MKNLKKVLAAALSFTMLLGCAACGGTNGDNSSLVVWTFSSDTKAMVDMYNAAKGKNVNVKEYPQDSLETKLNGVLKTGKNTPDVVALEISFVKQYVEGGKLIDLGALGLGERAKSELYEYTVDIGTSSEGKLVALSNQAAPGGFFYRRSMAKELWGNDSPEFVQEKMSTWDKVLTVAEELKAKDKYLYSNLNAAEKVFLCERESGWVKDGVLQIDECWNTYLEQIRTIQDNKYCHETVEYGAGGGWYTDIAGDSVFGYFLGAWGLNYHLKANAKLDENHDSTGDWGVIQGPTPYYNGGTWFAGVSHSKKLDQIKDLLNYWMFDQEFLKAWANKTQDFIGNKLTVESIKNDFHDEFLQGQNHYALFADIADQISAKHVTIYDGTIGGMFSAAALEYAMRKVNTMQEAYTAFRTNVSFAYSSIQTGI